MWGIGPLLELGTMTNFAIFVESRRGSMGARAPSMKNGVMENDQNQWISSGLGVEVMAFEKSQAYIKAIKCKNQ